MKLSELKINPDNPQIFDDLTSLENSIKDFPKMMKLRPMVYDPVTMQVLGGNKRLICLQNLGYKEIPDDWVKSADELTEDEKKRFIVQDNIQVGEWDYDILDENYDNEDLEEWGVSFSTNNEIIESEFSDEKTGTFTNNIAADKTAMYIGGVYGVISKELALNIKNKYDFGESEEENGAIFTGILKSIL